MSESSGARKLLVVDDEPEVEPMFRQRMRREVRAGVYEFLFARSGRHALEVLDENPDVQLVITDLNMPEMNGWQLLHALGEQWPELPSMVVSAYGDDEKRQARCGEWRGGFCREAGGLHGSTREGGGNPWGTRATDCYEPLDCRIFLHGSDVRAAAY